MLPRISSEEEYQQHYQRSIHDPEGYWRDIATNFDWHKPATTTLEWNFEKPEIKWFEGAELNITSNCLDRHAAATPDKVALLWEPNDPMDAPIAITFAELLDKVETAAASFRALGLTKGDRVCLYMPMIPELAIAVLACARIGAIHSVVFAGFSATALADRIQDASCKVVITADEGYRGMKRLPIKAIVDEALAEIKGVETVVVVQRTGAKVDMIEGRDIFWDAMPAGDHREAAIMQAEDPLFILYTSGSTGKPKGVVHTCAGYMVYAAYSFNAVFEPEHDDVYWCSADIGWITGHTYIIYGPWLNGTTSLMFEGIPTWPRPDRFWQTIARHGVTLFYTAPTAIRALMAHDRSYVTSHDLSSLKVLGTVGEPINEEAWHWYHDVVGGGRCPVLDTWWQTETGGILISALPRVHPQIPTYATKPLPGVQPILVDAEGSEITTPEAEGLLCIKFPWPGMLRTTWGDHERCRQTYFSSFKGLYFTGDGARRDADGNYRIIGRVDDVINVSGHRIGTAEVENAINQHPNIIESAVVGYPHDIKGQGIYAFVIGATGETIDTPSILDMVTKEIGPIAKPDQVLVVDGLPKTRSGKIMRRLLRKIAEGNTDQLGDTSTLLDPSVVDRILKASQSQANTAS